MMHLGSIIEKGVIEAVKQLYGADISAGQITMNSTRKEFEGDYTVVVFPFTRIARKKPEEIGKELGEQLVQEVDAIVDFNVIKGFLNLVVGESFWNAFLQETVDKPDYGHQQATGQKVVVEFSSPNTNKPLHLGHIRNILLGWSTAKIQEAAGHEVFRVQIVNDRGIAICKSMLAWQEFGEGMTPGSSGIKGDHLVGKFYVEFEQRFRQEYAAWQQTPEAEAIYEAKSGEEQSKEAFFKKYKNTYFNEQSELGRKAKEMLIRWEAGDPETVELWKQMNEWVYEGFNATYEKLGVTFDKLYFESDTYVLGKDLIRKGLDQDVFYRKDDGSVWIDLEDSRLDHKLVLRSDGTSVYMTQDIGTAHLRYEDFDADKMVYVVADEQNYHFQVLFEILKRLGEPYADGLHHLSYGMVELPEGKMKSREGTVVDADDLIEEVMQEARRNVEERGEITELPKAEREDIIRKIALAALKFFIIKVQPRKGMIFNPQESVDMQGQTGPYVQYSYVRINGILKRAEREGVTLQKGAGYSGMQPLERELLNQVYQFNDIILQASEEYDPSALANYCYSLAKTYSRFWHELPVFNAEDESAKAFRLQISKLVGTVLKNGMDLLGIEMPEKM